MKALALLLVIGSPAMAQEASTGCGPYKDYLAKLAKDFNEQPVARALSKTGAMLTVTASPDGATYTVLATQPDATRTTCEAGEGKDWEAVTPPAAGDPT